jgi:hypothetical protein
MNSKSSARVFFLYVLLFSCVIPVNALTPQASQGTIEGEIGS